MVADQSTEIVLCVESTKYASDHPAWREQVGHLRRWLHEVGRYDDIDECDGEAVIAPVRLRLPADVDEAKDPTKGVLEMSALMLASGSMIRAAAVVIREWRRQDATRSVSIKLVRRNAFLEIDGKGVGGADAAYQALLTALESGDDEPAAKGHEGQVRAG